MWEDEHVRRQSGNALNFAAATVKRNRCTDCIRHDIHFIFIIREYGSTLYVGLARAVSPTNTNFRLTFLLTRLQEALYEDLAV